MPSEIDMSLDEKEKLALNFLAELANNYSLQDIAVAWTGGKDSTTLLHLWKSYLEGLNLERRPALKALNLDTGLKFPEVLQFRDYLASLWEVDIYVARPETEATVAKDPVKCCSKLKIEPLKKAIRELGVQVLLTGLRRDEHPQRTGRQRLEYKQDPAYIQANPLLAWKEMDIWSFHLKQGLPYCCLYDQGYRSLGCKPCTDLPSVHGDERSGREQDKEGKLDLLRSLGYF